MTEAVKDAKPGVVVHEMTSLAGSSDLRRFDRWFAATNELGTRGTDILLSAALAAGTTRFVAQSYTGGTNPRSGSTVKTEDDGFDPEPAAMQRRSLAAIKYLERTLTAAPLEGVVLRRPGLDVPAAEQLHDQHTALDPTDPGGRSSQSTVRGRCHRDHRSRRYRLGRGEGPDHRRARWSPLATLASTYSAGVVALTPRRSVNLGRRFRTAMRANGDFGFQRDGGRQVLVGLTGPRSRSRGVGEIEPGSLTSLSL
jgi:hypothetical protein